jgi:DNA anti-recombination protein RmuC
MNAMYNIPLKQVRLIFLMMMVLMAACSANDTSAEDQQRLEESKNTTAQALVKMKVDIENRIAYIDQELQTARGRIRVRLTEARAELDTQKVNLENEIRNVNQATLETWNEVVDDASESLARAKSKTNEVSRKVRAMLDA